MRAHPSMTRLWRALLILLTLLAAAVPFKQAQAGVGQTFTVTKTTDTNDGACTAADCSLREAVIAANATPGADTINLPAGAYVLSIAGINEDLAASGDLDVIAPLTITGAGRGVTSIDGADLDRVFELYHSAGTVSISGVTIKNGSASNDGGCLNTNDVTLNLTGVAVSDCVSSLYGGGLNLVSGTLTITRSLLKNNSAVTGAAIFAYNTALTLTSSQLSGNTASNSGGGLYLGGSAASLHMNSCLVNANTAMVEGAGVFTVDGTTAVISNSTISGNISAGYGGGLNTRIPTLVTHTTIVNNIADNDNNDAGPRGGGVFLYLGNAQAQFKNSLVANNLDKGEPDSNDCLEYGAAHFTSLGYNLVENPGSIEYSRCTLDGPGDITGLDPMLGPLRNNGGTLATHALLPGSPAINAGDPAFAPPPAFDQRGTGYPRLQGGRLDMGAFELPPYSAFLPLMRRP